MKSTLVAGKLERVTSELLVIFAYDGAEKKQPAKAALKLATGGSALAKAAAKIMDSGEFAAGSCDTVLLHAPDGLKAQRILLVGVGKLNLNEVRKAAGAAVRFAKPRKLRELTVAVPEGLDPSAAARAIVEGAFMGDFDPDSYRSDRKDQSIEQLNLIAPGGNQSAVETGLREGVIVGEAQSFARSLINEPGNVLTPTVLGEKAAEMCRQYGLKCEVFGADKLKELKMGAFWAVAKGSEQPPALIVMTYEPAKAPASPVLGLVGKGITFDTGGISIKSADGMEKMKYDMAGGAAMIGAMQAIAQLKPAVKVIGLVCAAENMPSGSAMRPGDVEIAMSGKSIEIINTDAEGRLVLADGLAYAQQLGATHLIDAATLTGAVVVALGTFNAGSFSNDDETYGHFSQAATASGERFWRLPLEDEYRDMIKSNIADIMNTGGTRHGGAITAAMFLKEFAGDTPWIHLDIAGLAWIDEAKPWMAKGPSGFAMRTILEWVRSYAK